MVGPGYRAHRPAHARQLGTHARAAGGAAVPGRAAGRSPAALSVIPGLTTGGGGRHARADRRLAAGMEMGWHPPAGTAPPGRGRAVVARRRTAGWALPGDRSGGDGAARWLRDRWRTAGLGRRR